MPRFSICVYESPYGFRDWSPSAFDVLAGIGWAVWLGGVARYPLTPPPTGTIGNKGEKMSEPAAAVEAPAPRPPRPRSRTSPPPRAPRASPRRPPRRCDARRERSSTHRRLAAPRSPRGIGARSGVARPGLDPNAGPRGSSRRHRASAAAARGLSDARRSARASRASAAAARPGTTRG